jgi:hypothetical protein
MSQSGQSRSFDSVCSMSELPLKAEVDPRSCDVAKVPIRDIGIGVVIDSASKIGYSAVSTDHLLARKARRIRDLATAVVPNGAAHVRHEIRYCKGPQSTGVRST